MKGISNADRRANVALAAARLVVTHMTVADGFPTYAGGFGPDRAESLAKLIAHDFEIVLKNYDCAAVAESTHKEN